VSPPIAAPSATAAFQVQGVAARANHATSASVVRTAKARSASDAESAALRAASSSGPGCCSGARPFSGTLGGMLRLGPPLALAPALSALALTLLASCGNGSPASPGSGKGVVLDQNKRLMLKGTVLDRATQKALPSALVVIEEGGMFLDVPDAASASPYYQFGGVTAPDGSFALDLPEVTTGIHVFADGYLCGRFVTSNMTTTKTIGMDVIPPSLQANAPAIASFGVDAPEIAAGGILTFTADVAAGKVTPSDPLSDEVLVVQPDSNFAAELDPPAPGSLALGYPDGRWTRKVLAPATAGTYTYYLVAMSQGCVPSTRKSVVVTVK
jgi:hypothetical protein